LYINAKCVIFGVTRQVTTSWLLGLITQAIKKS